MVYVKKTTTSKIVDLEASEALVAALIALIVVREGGTSRELSEARAAAQVALDKAGVAVELPRY